MTLELTTTMAISSSSTACCICFERLVGACDEQQGRSWPCPHKHVFHGKCLESWWRYQWSKYGLEPVCPICKGTITGHDLCLPPRDVKQSGTPDHCNKWTCCGLAWFACFCIFCIAVTLFVGFESTGKEIAGQEK
jgi:hypothetical protein